MNTAQSNESGIAAQAELEALRAENARLKAASAKPAAGALRCKVGASGGVSVYGLGRFPVTLYQEQWMRLAEFMPSVRDFIADHRDELKAKPASA